MSIGSLGIVGSLAGAAQAQKSVENDRTQPAVTGPARQVDAAERAEAAAGIGQTEEDSEASERDADGRRPWERTDSSRNDQQDDAASTQPVISQDPTGEKGRELDLLG